MIKQRIMYVCSECAEGCPEACGHYDRTELRVMPDGAWLCESCFDNNDDNEFLSWGHLPAPEEYGRIPDSAQTAVPALWICFADNGNIRAWTRDHNRKELFRLDGLDMQPFYAESQAKEPEASGGLCTDAPHAVQVGEPARTGKLSIPALGHASNVSELGVTAGETAPNLLADLAEQLREYTAMKYAGDCKCGKCQLVPRPLVERIYHALNAASLSEGDQAPAAYRETVEKVAAAREKRLTELVEDLTAIFNATKLYEPKRAAEIIAFVRNRASHTLSSTNLGSGVRDV